MRLQAKRKEKEDLLCHGLVSGLVSPGSTSRWRALWFMLSFSDPPQLSPACRGQNTHPAAGVFVYRRSRPVARCVDRA